jgi:ribosome biogenesis GTPase
MPAADGGPGAVLEIEPRSTALERPDSRGRTEVMAANVSQLLIVCAHEPQPDPFLVDRYLATAELMPCKAMLVYNKADLRVPKDARWLEEIEAIGCPVLRTSAKTNAALAPLLEALAGHTSILVGQSGVGQSSLLNALVPGIDTATAALSEASGLGRHTTSAAVLHRLPNGGAIIDSPGVRDHAPAVIPPREVARGFVEFAEPALECRFADCLHRDEPGCGVKAGVSEGRLSARRYESYLRLLRLMEQLKPAW